MGPDDQQGDHGGGGQDEEPQGISGQQTELCKDPGQREPDAGQGVVDGSEAGEFARSGYLLDLNRPATRVSP